MASTQVARETILADRPANGASTTDLNRFEPKKPSGAVPGRPPSMYLGKSKETLDITMRGTLEGDNLGDDEICQNQPSSDSDSKAQVNEGTAAASRQSQTEPHNERIPAERPVTASAWLGGWLGRPTVQPASIRDKPEATKTSEPANVTEEQAPPAEQPLAAAAKEEALKTSAAPSTSTSWFGLWSTAAPSTVDAPKEQVPIKIAEGAPDVVMEDAPLMKRV